MDMNVHMKYDKTAISKAFNAFSEEQIQTLFNNLWFKTFKSSKEPLQAVTKWQESIMYLVELTGGSSLRRGIDLGPWWMLLRGYITVADRQTDTQPPDNLPLFQLLGDNEYISVHERWIQCLRTYIPAIFPNSSQPADLLGRMYYWTRFWGSGMLY